MKHNLWKYDPKQYVVICAFLILIALLLGACGQGPSSGNTADEMFRSVITHPIPANVSDVQGVGDTWQGYQLFLRFHTNEAFTEQLLTGYESVGCAEVLTQFTLPNTSYDQFLPSWSPQSVVDPECFRTTEPVQNEWTHAGEHFLLLNRQTGEVYFVGVGA